MGAVCESEYANPEMPDVERGGIVAELKASILSCRR
jgi:hypothetical protein